MPSLSEFPDVDNEATAELPVLDVAAYESTLAEHTDSWAIETITMTPAAPILVEATAEMPKMKGEAIPTLPAYDIDHSGTHEMPAIPPLRQRPADILPMSDAFLQEIGKSFGRDRKAEPSCCGKERRSR